MSLLDLLSSTVESLQEVRNKQTSLSEPRYTEIAQQEQEKVTEVLDTKFIEGVQFYLCKYQGSPKIESSWKKSSDMDCNELIEEFNASRPERPNLDLSAQEPDNGRKNAQLETVKEALRHLGGRAFGGVIVDWICENGIEMLKAYGNDRKKLRYCVNGLLSARVNSSIFEKKAYKQENGSTKTEWMLTEAYLKNLPDIANQNILKISFPEKDPIDSNLASAEDSENSMDDEKGPNTTADDDDNNSVGVNTRSARASKNRIPSEAIPVLSPDPNPYAKNFPNRSKNREKKKVGATYKDSAFDIEREEDGDSSISLALQDGDPMMEDGVEYDTLLNSPESSGSGSQPPTYRGMIKAALENLNGQGTFEAISKFIGIRFKDQLSNKADTWKHSIAGCLSVYFARREQKDNSGKVIWTLGEPPKPKRRGKKRERSDSGDAIYAERESYSVPISRSSSYSYANEYVVPYVSKKKKDEMVMVSAEHLEFLEEENECLKLLVAKKQREDSMMNFHVANSNINNNSSSSVKTRHSATVSIQNPLESTACVCCSERHELGMMVNPCGHLFCGSVFCNQSTSNQCTICDAQITGRIPFRGNRMPSSSSKGNNQKVSKQARSTSNLSTITPSYSSTSTTHSLPILSKSPSSDLSSLASIIDDKKMDFTMESSRIHESEMERSISGPIEDTASHSD